MRGAIILAGAMMLMAVPTAQAEEWCGYAARAKSLIECGYSSVSECENALGNRGMCFVDPEVAFNGKGFTRREPAIQPQTGTQTLN
jgi:hypothetical protein